MTDLPCFERPRKSFAARRFGAAMIAAAGVICTAPASSLAEEACKLTQAESAALLPRTAPPRNLKPLAEPGKALPDDCGFYKWAWEAFLYATQPADGKTALLSLATFEDVFKVKESRLFADQQPGLLSLAPQRAKAGGAAGTALFKMRDMLQAGSRDVLVDQQGNAVWYAIHLNKTFQSFVQDYGLLDVEKLRNLPKDLEFRTGSLELKSAWKIIEGPPPKNYITTRAVIPVFKTDQSGDIVRDGGKTRVVTVALLGLHVVGTIEGHPEFIWATFEHVLHEGTGPWQRDLAPTAKANPSGSAPPIVESGPENYTLYPKVNAKDGATPARDANDGESLYSLKLDEKTQTFSPHSNVYRVFPGSKSDDPEEDDAVTSLNADMQAHFQSLGGYDVRSNYQLVGGIWLNTPQDDFKAGVDFQAEAAKPRKQPLFGGEDRLSNMSMESFTQPSNSSPNCFSCHNTEGVSGLGASRLNMSHALSKFFSIVTQKP